MSENPENNLNTQPAPEPTPVVEPQPAPVQDTNYQQTNTQKKSIPNEYKPLSPWAYVGYNLLFSIPLVGFIMLIVFSFDNANINRRNYARSFFCAMLIGLIVAIILSVIVFGIVGLSFTAFSTATSSSTSSNLVNALNY